MVVSRDEMPIPDVAVVNVELSDHCLLRWSAKLTRPPPVYTSSSVRSWRSLDIADLRAGLQPTLLCRPEMWREFDVDGLARLFDNEVNTVVNRLVPVRTVKCRRRPSDPWFDEDCRAAKRLIRRHERIVHRVDPTDIPATASAVAAWSAHRHAYRALLRVKRESFWRTKVDAERSSPRLLWRSVDTLMGRGRVPASDVIDAVTFHRSFDEKVAAVRSSTADAPPPSFSAAPPGCSFNGFRPLVIDDVIAVVSRLPDKQCAADPLPTSLLKQCVDRMAPFLTYLFNRSLSSCSRMHT